MSIENPTLAHFRHFSSLFTIFRSTTVENVRQITPFYAKQTQFQKWQKNINTFLTMRYKILDTLMGQKTKPTQTQFKPKQTQFKPNLSRRSLERSRIYRKGENERFCVDREPYDCFNNASRGIYHPKGCQFQMDYLLTNC